MMNMVNPLPAIMIGGPPHSGKSVLAYQLTQHLRLLHVDHYLLRACPDGEGDWSQEAEPQTVRMIRHKGQFTAHFVTNVISVLNHRMMPLLVDVGGRPQPDQEAILAACSHAILIAQDAGQLANWRELAARLQIPIIAELISSLTEADMIQSSYPLLHARIHGLERGTQVEGPVLRQLTGLGRAVLAVNPQRLREFHLTNAPVETTVDLERLAHTLDSASNGRWQPQTLSALLGYLPQDEPLALYGRSPNWVYGALACYLATTPFYQFDARLGWVQPARVQRSTTTLPDQGDGPLNFSVQETDAYITLHIHFADPYLVYGSAGTFRLPSLPLTKGLIVSGPLPMWLLTGLLRACTDMPWIAVYHPPLQGAVTVYSTYSKRRVGDIIRVDVSLFTPTLNLD